MSGEDDEIGVVVCLVLSGMLSASVWAALESASETVCPENERRLQNMKTKKIIFVKISTPINMNCKFYVFVN